LTFEGFVAAEKVTLTIGHPDSEFETPAAPAVSADPLGRVSFDVSSVRLDPMPPPERRVYRARGETSACVAERPVGARG
jgi:hypothetical protein